MLKLSKWIESRDERNFPVSFEIGLGLCIPPFVQFEVDKGQARIN